MVDLLAWGEPSECTEDLDSDGCPSRNPELTRLKVSAFYSMKSQYQSSQCYMLNATWQAGVNMEIFAVFVTVEEINPLSAL